MNAWNAARLPTHLMQVAQIETCEARIAKQIDDLTPPDGSGDDGGSNEISAPEADGAVSNTASHRSGGRKRAGHEKALTTALPYEQSVPRAVRCLPSVCHQNFL